MDSEGQSEKIVEQQAGEDVPGMSLACEVGVTKCVTFELESTNQRVRMCLDPGMEAKMNSAHTADKYSDPDQATKEAFKVTSCTSDHCNTVPNLSCNEQVWGAPFQPQWKQQANGYVCEPFQQYAESENMSVSVSEECERNDFYFNEQVMPQCYNLTGTNGFIINTCLPWSDTTSWKPTFQEDSECTIAFQEDSCTTDNCNTSYEYTIITCEAGQQKNNDECIVCPDGQISSKGSTSCFPLTIVNHLKKIDLSKINQIANQTCISQTDEELYKMDKSGNGLNANQSLTDCTGAGNHITITHCLNLFLIAINCFDGTWPCGELSNNQEGIIQTLDDLAIDKAEGYDQCMIAADSESTSDQFKIEFKCNGYDDCNILQACFNEKICSVLQHTYEYEECVAQCANANANSSRSLNESNNDTIDMEMTLSRKFTEGGGNNNTRLNLVYVIAGLFILITVILCISICVYFNCNAKVSIDLDEQKDEIDVN